MGRPKLRPGAESTSHLLLLAAEDEFAAAGYDGAKLQTIAEQAGISRPSLLYHYGTKHALYSSVVRNVFAELGAALTEALGGPGTFDRQLDRVLGGFLDFVKARPSAAKMLLREVVDDRGPGHGILLEAGVPVLEMVERFIRINGRDVVAPGVPVRTALLQIVSAAFVKVSSGDLEVPLWGEVDRTKELARYLFLGRSG